MKLRPANQTKVQPQTGFLACFPTFIYFSTLERMTKAQSQHAKHRATHAARFNREILEQCYLVRGTDEAGAQWSSESYPGGYTSYGSITDLHRRYPHFEELERRLKPHVRKFARRLDWDLQGGSLIMSSCWINIMGSRAGHSLHLHPLSVVSGTYYVQVPRKSSQIKFEDPRLDRYMAAPPRVPNARFENESILKCHPRAGQLALWESWLRHEVSPNGASDDRVSISFNFDWVSA